jgi:hypothetical protein
MSHPLDKPNSLLERANTALIRYPRFKELHHHIRYCQQMSKVAGEPQCMTLEGVTGAGKSTLVQDYARSFPRVLTDAGVRIPVFYMETPSPVTVKGMAAAMLEHLGDPAAHRGTQWSMNSRLIKLMIACQVEIAILDDFHHLIDCETNRVLAKVSDWLKVLIKETGLPFLVVGIEDTVERILDLNPQLSRLFAARESLAPFQWDMADETCVWEFAQFVQYAEEAIGIALTDALPRTELLYRLHYATGGVVGNLMNLLRCAAIRAQETGTEQVGLSTLDWAFRRRLARHLKDKINPFVQAEDERFVAPEPSEGAPKKRDAGQHPPPISSILTTRCPIRCGAPFPSCSVGARCAPVNRCLPLC